MVVGGRGGGKGWRETERDHPVTILFESLTQPGHSNRHQRGALVISYQAFERL